RGARDAAPGAARDGRSIGGRQSGALYARGRGRLSDDLAALLCAAAIIRRASVHASSIAAPPLRLGILLGLAALDEFPDDPLPDHPHPLFDLRLRLVLPRREPVTLMGWSARPHDLRRHRCGSGARW